MEDVPTATDSSPIGETETEGPRTEVYLPTLAEIAALTAEIRAGWSPAEFHRRAVGPRRVEWTVPRGVAGE